jgi:hypothetical protein
MIIVEYSSPCSTVNVTLCIVRGVKDHDQIYVAASHMLDICLFFCMPLCHGTAGFSI